MNDTKIKIGNRGEQFVSDWLIKKGYKVLERNIRDKIGEIDIIALHPNKQTISFIEVRTRANTQFGHPLETISPHKQRKIRNAANLYLCKNGITNIAMQFDVASIVWSTNEFLYIENAF
ncbi:MAG: YraN family protein [Deltaproteobacteria bacterium]|nr:YraN family protein [Deltaproteobacteria bacterium]